MVYLGFWRPGRVIAMATPNGQYELNNSYSNSLISLPFGINYQVFFLSAEKSTYFLFKICLRPFCQQSDFFAQVRRTTALRPGTAVN